ncbi:hypothetical protein ACFV4M_30590 [Kitasatospora indigofera]|uniref:hypothetical protein n=1 Tax=Kitasatospora indigofera TaxID=67307 RepID=UPI00364A954B
MQLDPVPFSRAHTTVAHWLSNPNIVLLDTCRKTVGGERTDQPAILVGVVRKLPQGALTPRDFPVPPSVEVDILQPDGRVERTRVPTDVVETGQLAPRGLTGHRRPCPGGYQITAAAYFYEGIHCNPGTLGVTTTYRNQRCLLSNAHVLCAWVNQVGREIYQPMWSQWRPWSKENMIGRCDAAYEIISYWTYQENEPRNTYDFAWSVVDDSATAESVIEQVNPGGVPVTLGVPTVGQEVEWIGSTTGVLQQAKIASLDALATIPVWFGYQFWENCLRLEPMDGSRPVLESGDSGAAILDMWTRELVGLATMSDEQSRSDVIIGTRIPPDDPTPENFLGTQQLIFPS